MAELYDSEKIRAAARAIHKQKELLEVCMSTPEQIVRKESEQLYGKAANAMRERFEEFWIEIESINNELKSLEIEMKGYVNAIESVGEKLRQAMQ